MSEQEDDERLRAIIRESERNARTNPAVAADTRYKPSTWTDAQTAALMREIHGDERERIDRLIAEANEENRRT